MVETDAGKGPGDDEAQVNGDGAGPPPGEVVQGAESEPLVVEVEEPTPEAPVEARVAELLAKVAQLEKEKGEAHDRMLRIAAEFENWKKRARREAEEASGRGREQLAKEILPVLDNLERALAAVGAAGGATSLESLGQGVKLVDKQLHGVLDKFEIKAFDALGQAFDPARHEAIQQLETAEYPAGAVAKVFARGYTIGSRLLRPAMVAVAKQPPAVEPAAPASDGGEQGA